MNARFILFFTIMLLFTSVINLYIGWNAWLFVRAWMPELPPMYFGTVFAILSYSYVIGAVQWPKPVMPVARLMKVIGSYYFFVMELAVLLIPTATLLYWILRWSGIEPSSFVIWAGATISILMAVFLLWGSRNAWNTVVRHHQIDVDKPGGKFKKMKIAVASDLHLGNIVGNRHLRKLVNRMNAMEPDLILLPGDVLDDSIEPFIRNNMINTLKRLKAKHGVYAVLGNHEYYGRHIESYVNVMKEHGIQVLRDETVLIADSIYVSGRKDRTAESMDPAKRKSVAELVAGLDLSQPLIMMDHQPHAFDKAAEAGVDLLLCGHTHRGQFAPNHWITRRMFELDWGYMRKGNMHVAVSSGYGTWGPPIRIASRSEILEIDVNFHG